VVATAFGVNVHAFPDGAGEVAVFFDHWAFPDLDASKSSRFGGSESWDERKAGEDEREEGSASWRDVENTAAPGKAKRRARARVRRMARAAQLRYMWTFTFPVPVHDLNEAARLVAGWLHSPAHRNGPGKRFFDGCYVAVPERHPGGHGWHWHVLVGRHADVNLVRISWTRYLRLKGRCGEEQLARVNVKLWGSARTAAAYAAKYVSKAFEAADIPAGSHRYKVGDSVGYLAPVYGLIIAGDVHEAVDKVMAQLTDDPFSVWVVPAGTGPPGALVSWGD
jgi:hypothetical protein